MPNASPPVLDRRLKHLIRVQILSPLSVLISLAALGIGTFILRPSLSDVGDQHWTYLTPRSTLLLSYWAVLYLAQIGFTIFITLASGSEHVNALVSSGVGLRLAFANVALAIWVPLWVVNTKGTFIANTVLLGLAAVGLLFTVLMLQLKSAFRPSFSKRPFEWLCVNLPLKMFLLVLLQVDVWQQLFMALGLDAAEGKSALAKSTWIVFAIVTGTAAIGSLWIAYTTDFVWFAAGTYLYLSVLLNHGPINDRKGGDNGKVPPPGADITKRPPEVLAALILAIALYTTAFIASIAWSRLAARREGRIALPITAEEEEAAEQARRRRLAKASAKGSSRTASASAAQQAEPTERDALLAHQDEERAAQQQEPTPSQLEQGQGEGDVQVTRRLGSDSH